MKVCSVVLLLGAVVFVECYNTFIGTNVDRLLVNQTEIQFEPVLPGGYRIVCVNFTVPDDIPLIPTIIQVGDFELLTEP